MRRAWDWVKRHFAGQIDKTSWTIGVVHRRSHTSMTYLCFFCFQLVIIWF